MPKPVSPDDSENAPHTHKPENEGVEYAKHTQSVGHGESMVTCDGHARLCTRPDIMVNSYCCWHHDQLCEGWRGSYLEAASSRCQQVIFSHMHCQLQSSPTCYQEQGDILRLVCHNLTFDAACVQCSKMCAHVLARISKGIESMHVYAPTCC